MSQRIRWLAGPVSASFVLLAVSRDLDNHFRRGLPPMREVSPELVARLSLGSCSLVATAWLVGLWRSRRGRP